MSSSFGPNWVHPFLHFWSFLQQEYSRLFIVLCGLRSVNGIDLR
ncbi:hypothetical protein [Aquirufa ecclesiirivi]|nr:hypothetical protein [Aquirufa ecclesiirivi]